MPHDALRTLSRLRDAALDDARRDLAQALEAEEVASMRRQAAEQTIQDETRFAAESNADIDVERFACWLKGARGRLRVAEQAVANAEATTAARRATLNLARAASEATANAVAARDATEQQRQNRVTQRDQDEIGLRRVGVDSSE